MADNIITFPIVTESGGTYTAVTTGAYDLRVSPFSSTGISGTHLGSGIWGFVGLSDTAAYKLYDTSAGTEVTSFTGGGTNTRSFYDTSLQAYLALAGGTMSGNIAMGGAIITGSGAASANGHLPRWEQTGVITELRTISGQWLYTTLPSASPGNSTLPPTASGHFTPKWYVDALFGGAVGVVQSTYKIQLLPLRAIEDSYSRTTAELCNTYLSGLTDISTRTGIVQIEAMGTATNTINLDDGTSAWISAGVWYVGKGSKPILNRRAPNSSLTVAGGIVNCRIKDGATGTPVVPSREYVNFTFQDCEFDVPDTTDITFTTCKFLGTNKLKSVAGNTITLTNCTGDAFWHNDLITPVVSGTQPADIKAVTTANLNW